MIKSLLFISVCTLFDDNGLKNHTWKEAKRKIYSKKGGKKPKYEWEKNLY